MVDRAGLPRAAAGAARGAEVPTDPTWQRARGEDDLDRARLAEAEGAAALWDVAVGGGEAEAVALSALPFAEDAESVLEALVTRAATGDAAGRRARLVAALAVAARPATSRDPLDPAALRSSAALLVAIASRADVPVDERAIAVSAARALAGKGYLDAARVPVDLDP